MPNPDFRPHPYRITQDDIFLVYAAFKRSIHHFNSLQDAPEFIKRRYLFDYSEIFTRLKHCTQESQNDDHHTLFEQEFSMHAENFPRLSDFSNAHIHARLAHYVTDASSKLPDKGHLQFYKSKNICHFDECERWLPSPLKETLVSTPSTDRLRWCVRLLVAYHYESECSMFMYSAFKLCLNAVILSPIAECKSAKAVFQTMTWHLEVFRNLLTEAFQYRSKYIDRCADYLFYRLSSNNFSFLMESGVSYGYSYERLAALKWWMSIEFRGMTRILPDKTTSEKCQYYCLQIFFINRITRSYCRDDLLRDIWDCIPEPFVTEGDIRACFSHMANNDRCEWWSSALRLRPLSEWVKEVYVWYNHVVVVGETDVRSPRRLQHLSRCAIRASLKFPMNVNSLNLPQRLRLFDVEKVTIFPVCIEKQVVLKQLERRRKMDLC